MLDRALERTASESRYNEVFWTSFLPNGQGFSPRAARYSTAGWFGTVQGLCQRSESVRLALLANSLGTVGQATGQQQLVVEGWRMYGCSLQVLARSLAVMSREKSDELHATCCLLAQYQVRPSIWPLQLLDCNLTNVYTVSCFKAPRATAHCLWTPHGSSTHVESKLSSSQMAPSTIRMDLPTNFSLTVASIWYECSTL